MTITINIPIGLRQAPGKLRDNAITPATVTKLLRSLGPLLVGQSKLTFRDSRDPYGEPWAPLAKSTLANRKHGGDRPLEDTGALRNSINFKVGGDTLRIGPNVGYGLIHQTGGQTPARIIVPTKGKALAFFIGGVKIVRKSVKHPGSKIPRRAYLPDERGLPNSWRERIQEQVVLSLKASLG